MTNPLFSVGRKPALIILLALLIVPCMGVMPTAADVQEQRIEITIRDHVPSHQNGADSHRISHDHCHP